MAAANVVSRGPSGAPLAPKCKGLVGPADGNPLRRLPRRRPHRRAAAAGRTGDEQQSDREDCDGASMV